MMKGFTLIELIVVMGIIAILLASVANSINPGRQFAQTRDAVRRADIMTMVSAVYQYAADNNGNIPADITVLPNDVGNPAGAGIIDLSDDLVPTYLPAIPFDPATGSVADSDYTIFRQGNRVVASASGETIGNITIKW